MKENVQESFRTIILARRWFTGQVFEVTLKRPEGFAFIPGQKVRVSYHETGREYTLINSPGDSELIFCVRYFADGRFTPILAQSEIGSSLTLSAATGFFTYQTQEKSAIFVATGTGVAPFLAFSRAGITGFILLHGARRESDLLYRNEISPAAGEYIPCITASESETPYWRGRVTTYMEEQLIGQDYDFYLCGNRAMIRDAFRIIDRKFSGSRVFAETFF
jgi:benzoate/toluate 1,2-dioxygenase reductase component